MTIWMEKIQQLCTLQLRLDINTHVYANNLFPVLFDFIVFNANHA